MWAVSHWRSERNRNRMVPVERTNNLSKPNELSHRTNLKSIDPSIIHRLSLVLWSSPTPKNYTHLFSTFSISHGFKQIIFATLCLPPIIIFHPQTKIAAKFSRSKHELVSLQPHLTILHLWTFLSLNLFEIWREESR